VLADINVCSTIMTTVCFTQFGLSGRRSLRAQGFTLIESLATVVILSIMLYVTVGSLESLRSTSRLTAAQNLVSALEEARSDAMRTSSSSLIVFRQKADDFGVQAYREFGLLQKKGGVSGIVWRQLPSGIVLWAGLPENIKSGTNVLSIAAQTPIQHGITGLRQADNEAQVAIVFGDLGEVTFPTAQAAKPGAAPTPGPYYLCVTESAQMKGETTPTNLQLIEIRATTGRAQLLP
jgi:prepilin-type N-terminal cleavage/methylation domain-containing protein